jgi:hypothetical protein
MPGDYPQRNAGMRPIGSTLRNHLFDARRGGYTAEVTAGGLVTPSVVPGYLGGPPA